MCVSDGSVSYVIPMLESNVSTMYTLSLEKHAMSFFVHLTTSVSANYYNFSLVPLVAKRRNRSLAFSVRRPTLHLPGGSSDQSNLRL